MFPPKKSDLIVGLLLADTQAGSRIAPIRPDLILPKISFKPNRGQLYLWEKWQNMMDILPKKLDWFIHLGEVLQGPKNQKGSTYELLTNDKIEQAAIFEDLMGPIIDRVRPHSSGEGKAWWLCRGSGWHEGEYGREADAVAKNLNAQRFPDGEPSGDVLDLPIGPFVGNFAHHHPVFMQYKTSALERELKWFSESPAQVEDENGTPLGDYDFVARGHVHRYDCVDTPMGMAVSCPGWQLQMRYTMVKDIARSYPPHVGFVLVYMSPRARAQGRRGIWLEPILYDHPKRKAATL
jgi:hypothetical protein